MSLPPLDIITGALLIGTWLSSLLYMVELIQAVYYFCHYKQDDWKLKTRVMVAFTIDTVSALGNYACVYLYTITHAGDPMYLANQNWPMPLYLVATAIVAVLVQSFLVERYWRLTKNIIITLFLGLLILAACGGAFTVGMVVALFPAFKDRAKVKIPRTIWVVTQAVSDLVIAGTLLWEFRKANPGSKEMRSMLNRLAAQTIQTGTVSATTAATALMMYLLNNESNVTVGIGFCIGRIHVLTMLSNLNFRRPNSASSTGTSTGASTGTRSGTLEFRAYGVADSDRCGIRDVVIDSEQDFPSEQFKGKISSAKSRANDSSLAEIEMRAIYSSKQQFAK
ncbi:hypothetical protein DFH08DRAFT_1033441 [Mycena albidolilacea]|uniref:DUF6534 domain-containing protein n=1 Tax=Mycena albidolilacea TaxID=1033008 RepID=A0AAD6ZG11_9AGAR|nr:hypothetical protein DFH08DRAFT_1033441 [Mycena albidolilacea]